MSGQHQHPRSPDGALFVDADAGLGLAIAHALDERAPVAAS